jgi:hypothetical protein
VFTCRQPLKVFFRPTVSVDLFLPGGDELLSVVVPELKPPT